MAAKSRPEHLNIMSTREMDGALRVIALMEDNDLSSICRRAIEAGMSDSPAYQIVKAYVSKLTPEEYANLKLQLQNTNIPPSDRIPPEIKQALGASNV